MAVLFRKNPDGISEAVNDLSGELTNFWTILQGEASFGRFKRMVEAIPLSEVEFRVASDDLSIDPIEKAVDFFIRARQSRQGLMRDYATPTSRTRRRMNENVSAWLTAVDGLDEVHARLRRVEVRRMPALNFIRMYDHHNCCFYLDPPYLHETRSSTGEYEHEMDEGAHVELLELLETIEGKFVISCYPSDLYEEWGRRNNFQLVTREIDNKASGAKSKPKKTECLWIKRGHV
jgi:DNA adenine methylase